MCVCIGSVISREQIRKLDRSSKTSGRRNETVRSSTAAYLASTGNPYYDMSRQYCRPVSRHAAIGIFHLFAVFRSLPAIAVLLLVTGCKVGPDFKEPAAPVAAAWLEAGNSAVRTDHQEYTHWWSVFHDPVLDH